MTYLIDTDWIINYLKGHPTAVTFIRSHATDNLAISLITYGEVFEGIYLGKNPIANEVSFRQFIRGMTVLPLNRQIMQYFARIRGTLRAQGQIIGDFDMLIASTALHHSLTLVTENKKHFTRIPGLVLH